MKKQILVIILIAMGMIYYNQNSNQHPELTSSNQELVPVQHELYELQQSKQYQQLAKQQKVEEIHKVLEKIPPKYKKLKRQYQIAMASAPDILLVGRMIDQYGQPVVNARVGYSGSSIGLGSGGGMGTEITDENGYFYIDTTGGSLSLGYSGDDIQNSDGTIARFTRSQRKGQLNWNNYNSKENAYVINAWRLSEYEGAYGGSYANGYKSDGQIYTLFISQDRFKRNILTRKEGVFDKGLITLSCTRSFMSNHLDYGDWTATLTAINGGVLKTDDVYMNISPEIGYQPSIVIDMKKSDIGYKHYLSNEKYYYNSGGLFGSLEIEYTPFGTDRLELCAISIKYKINPTGSRNLELKKKQYPKPSTKKEFSIKYALN